jgi:hypothetical protein
MTDVPQGVAESDDSRASITQARVVPSSPFELGDAGIALLDVERIDDGSDQGCCSLI